MMSDNFPSVTHVIIVVDLDHRRIHAGSQALDFNQSKHLILRCLPGLDAFKKMQRELIIIQMYM